MMSSEEDPDPSHSTVGSSGAKSSPGNGCSSSSSSSKKRVRQRVDAGEPRNSYASIPNFSSRPPPGCSPLAALYSNGYAASKMLCDLLGSSARQQKEHEDMIVCNSTTNNGINRGMYVCDLVDRCSSGESSSGSNSHLLRDILQQGRDGHGPASPPEEIDGEEESSDGVGVKGSMAAARTTSSTPPSPCPSPLPLDSSVESKRARVETIVSNMLSVPKTNGTGQNGMQDGLQPSVNGCKKRKLYQPQQHEKRDHQMNGGDEVSGYEDDESFCGDESSSPVVKRRNMTAATNGTTGLFTFKQQLRNMQQQLVAMQQQYMEMLENDSTDEENNNNNTNNSNLPESVPNNNNNNNSIDDRPKSVDSTRDLKPAKTEPVSFVDYDNASMYDNGDHHPRRLVIDDTPSKDKRQTNPDHHNNRLSSPPSSDYEWLAESLKAELSTSLSQVVDAVVSRCVQRKAAMSKMDTSTPQDPKDPTLLSQMLDRKSPRTGKVIDRGTRVNGSGLCGGLRTSPYPPPQDHLAGTTPKPPFFFPLKPPASVAATAAFLYGSPPVRTTSPPSSSDHHHQPPPEQTEAMSLVVPSKKKRHKVTDTRLRPPLGGPPQDHLSPTKYPDHPLPPLYHHPPPPLVPVSLPTSVAIPNPSLNQSELFHHGGGHYDPSAHYRLQQHFAALEAPRQDDDDGPVHHPLHPLLAPFHRGSPDYSSHLTKDSGDMSDTGDSPQTYDSSMAMISFLPSSLHTSTLTPMHLRKAKLMFFFARYPSSAVLKMYFPDIRFNKNNTAQLVKWFSNFREFFYIQMEKYARQAITEGVKSAEELKVNVDSELLRVLNLHYNRNNHIPSPEQFRFVVEQTLREFYKALVAGKDSEQSWKKSIYKVIARMDDSVPDYFKSPNFLDTLE